MKLCFLFLFLVLVAGGCNIEKDSKPAIRAITLSTLPPGAHSVEILGNGWLYFWLGNKKFLYCLRDTERTITVTEVTP